jgi:crotonobetainyl-CoA:carnitine CoA-transferase CaiB-like acyl-CoA transferase
MTMDDAAQESRNGASPLPLAGLRVVDFTNAMAGPTCTMLLADFGADVVKVEAPAGDVGRHWGSERFGDNGQFSGLFLALNRNKRGIVLDLKSAADSDLALGLIEQADIVVESFTPGVADRLGIGYEQAKAGNPAVIYCSVSGFGQTGPLRSHRGIDQLLQAYAGHMSVTGEEGRPSVRIGPSAIDLVTGTNAAFGILLALRERDATGEGQYVETSLYDGALELITHFLGSYTGSGVVPKKSGPYFAFSSPYGIFQASDREFFLGAGSDRMFTRLCGLLDRPELLEDPRFKNNPERIRNRHALNEIILPVFATQTAAEWVDTAVKSGIPSCLVESLEDVCTQPQAVAREMLVETGVGTVRVAGIPVKLSATPGTIRSRAPYLGEHDDEIRADLSLASSKVPAGQ